MNSAISRLADSELDDLRASYRRLATDQRFSPEVQTYYRTLAGLFTTEATRRLSEISELAALYAR